MTSTYLRTLGLSVVALAAITIGFGFYGVFDSVVQAQSESELIKPSSGEVVRAGSVITIEYRGDEARAVHLLPTSNDLPRDRIAPSQWLAATIQDSTTEGNVRTLRVKLPEFTGSLAGITTTDAELRLTLPGNDFLYSQPFVLDGTAPECRFQGEPYVKKIGGENRLMVGFVPVGPDVELCRLRLTSRDPANPSPASQEMHPNEAARKGFAVPADGAYDLEISVIDRVGNESDPSLTRKDNFVIDTRNPELSVSLKAMGGYVIGGESIEIAWNVDELYPDYETFRLDYIEAGTMRVRGTIKAEASAAVKSMSWDVPYADIGRFRVRVSMRDTSGNYSEALSETFTMFSQRPEAFISSDAGTEGVRSVFGIKYIPAEPLLAMQEALNDQGFDFKVNVWHADSGTSPVVWSEENAMRDISFRPTPNAPRSEMVITQGTTNKAFAAQLVIVPTKAGAGAAAYNGQSQQVKDRWAALTEPTPDDRSSAPEALWMGPDRVGRIKMNVLEDDTVFLEGEDILLGYTVENSFLRSASARFEYRVVGEEEWNLIQNLDPRDIPTGTGTLTWRMNRAIPLAQVRVVTSVPSSSGVREVFDVLSSSITIDSDAPVDATIVRVTDEDGLSVQNGAFTNSAYLDIEYRGTDTVNGITGSGIRSFRLWDTAPSAFFNERLGTWNVRKFSPNLSANDMQRELAATERVYRVDFNTLAKAQLHGTLSFLLEGIDYAGNQRYGRAVPNMNDVPQSGFGADRKPHQFTVRIDRVVPSVTVSYVSVPNREDFAVKPGQDITLRWAATDVGPAGDNNSSMPENPVVIYVLDQDGNKSRFKDNLPATSEGYTFQIPAIANVTAVSFLVTAMDHAGNETNEESSPTALTRPIKVEAPKRPHVSLDRISNQVNQTVVSMTWKRLGGAPIEELRALLLWESVDGGDSWKRVGTFELANVGNPVNFLIDHAMDKTNGLHKFALTAIGNDGLQEPEPTSPGHSELEVLVDAQAPVISRAMMLPETRGDQAYVQGVEPQPEVSFVILEETDAHFDPKAVRITLTEPVGGKRVDLSNRLTDLQNGVPAQIKLPAELPGSYRVEIAAADSMGNNATPITLTYIVREPSQWELTTNWENRTDPVYWKTEQLIEWTRGGPRVRENIRLCFETVMRDNQGQLVQGQVMREYIVPDTLSFDLDAVPELPNGEYQLALYAIDGNGKTIPNRKGPFTIERPNPVVKMVLADQGMGNSAPIPLKTEQPSGLVYYGIAGEREVRFRLKVYHQRPDGTLLDYPLPPLESLVKKAVTVYYRHQPLGNGATIGPVEQLDDMFIEGPNTVRPVIVMGDVEVGVTPQRGEGTYHINARFVDNYGFKSQDITASTKADVALVFDATPPKTESESGPEDGDQPRVRILQTGATREVKWEVSDANLDIRSVLIEARPYGEPNATPQIFNLTIDDKRELLPDFRASMTSASGVTTLDLQRVGRYHITLVAEDMLGNIGRAELGGPIFAGRADYFALRPIEVENSPQEYTNESVSRKQDFRILVNYHNAWPEGLARLTLWSRPLGGEWRSQDFSRVNVTRNETALPFTATKEGVWEFIITSASVDGRSELPPGVTIDSLKPEKQVLVSFDGLRAYDLTVAPTDDASKDIVRQFDDGQLAAGMDYVVTWKMRAGVFAHSLAFTLSLSTNNGQTYARDEVLKRSRTGQPELYGYTVSPVRKLENGVEEKVISVIWRCPSELLLQDVDGAILRLLAEERSNTLPELSSEAFSTKYSVDMERRPTQALPEYYVASRDFAKRLLAGAKAASNASEHIKDTDPETGNERFILDDNGNKITRKLAIGMALEKYKAAQRELDTAEIQRLLSEYHSYIGDPVKAEYHREQSLLRKSEDDFREGRWEKEGAGENTSVQPATETANTSAS